LWRDFERQAERVRVKKFSKKKVQALRVYTGSRTAGCLADYRDIAYKEFWLQPLARLNLLLEPHSLSGEKAADFGIDGRHEVDHLDSQSRNGSRLSWTDY
jgi:hypothetical protein